MTRRITSDTTRADTASAEFTSGTAPVGPGAGISRGLVLLLAIATGVTVASNYYVQPLLDEIRQTFHVGPGAAGLVVTAAQIGYAVGLVLLVPLGDLVERRRLVVIMCLLTAGALVGAALCPDLYLLYLFAALAAAGSVVAQVLVAFAATVASDDERGRVVGTVMSGLLLGILLARTVAGYVAAAAGHWEAVYYMAAVLLLLTAVVLRATLPVFPARAGLTYKQGLVSVYTIFRDESILRRRSLFGGLSFACFAVLWTSLAFLLSGPPYHYGAGTIGLFGLAGAAGAFMASAAGRLADRNLQRPLTVAMAVAMLVGFGLLWIAPDRLIAIIAGIVVLDVGCQGMHITNQSLIYKLPGEARSRVNAAYMTCYFIGGTLGSTGSAIAYADFGWRGAALLGLVIAVLSLALAMVERPWRRISPAEVASV